MYCTVVVYEVRGCKELYQKVALKADKVPWDLRTSRLTSFQNSERFECDVELPSV